MPTIEHELTEAELAVIADAKAAARDLGPGWEGIAWWCLDELRGWVRNKGAELTVDLPRQAGKPVRAKIDRSAWEGEGATPRAALVAALAAGDADVVARRAVVEAARAAIAALPGKID